MSDKDFWNDAYQEDPGGTMVRDVILDDELADLPPGRALDLGCGKGDNALKLAKWGWRVVGVDWAPTAIALARRAAEGRGLDATFFVGDTTMWEPDGTFDLVISTYALPGGADSGRVLKVASRALAPGGTLLVAEWDQSMSEAWDFDPDDLPSPTEIVAHLPGLEIVKAEVRKVESPFSPDDLDATYGRHANVALVRARKPLLYAS
jgi:SAM-dependent methyltransferase